MNDRNIFFALITILVISTSMWIYYDVMENGKEINKLEKKYSGIENNFIMLAQIEESYDEVKQKHSDTIEYFDSLKTTIPTFDKYTNVLEKIRRLANKQAITIESFHPKMDDSFPALKTKLKYTQKHVERRPIQLRLYGTYFTIGAFLEEILKFDKIVNIHSLNLETELSDANMLSCDLVLFAYIFFDEYRKS